MSISLSLPSTLQLNYDRPFLYFLEHVYIVFVVVVVHFEPLLLLLLVLWQFTVPTVAPTITSAVRINATTARITWTAVDSMNVGGIISHYSVRHRPKAYPTENCSNTNASTWTTNTKTDEGTSIIITELVATLDYCVAVAATSSAGTGLYSTPVQRK